MFTLSLKVKVTEKDVVVAVRSAEYRVDEYTMPVDDFREVVASAKEHGKSVHLYFEFEGKREIFAVPKTDFNVMVAQFNAQVGK